MNTIKILPQHEAQKIAAGEVVERPASVIKELIENSLDAKATSITIHVEKAGKQLIQISDNGIGMSPTDTKLCFQPHATSKITTVNELNSLNSFGFRGEALASISSVSKVTVTTKQENSVLGTMLQLQDGKITKEEEVSAPQGTTFVINDLFYNTPARKKFLKQDETEWNKILLNIHGFTLSYIDVHFKLYRDGKIYLNAPPTKNTKGRVAQLFGHNFSENLLGLTPYKKEGLFIRGLISNHQFWRYNKNHFFFFVNNRLVKNQELVKGVMNGYLNVLPPQKFPAAIVFLEIDKSVVDVNVHPRKEEVQFEKPIRIKNATAEAVKNSLENYLSKTLAPTGEVKDFDFDEKPFTPRPFIPETNTQPITIYPNTKTLQSSPETLPPSLETTTYNKPNLPKIEITQNIVVEKPQQNVKIIGQILKTYILIEQDNALVIVDQHAAHERVLYEQFATKFEELDGTKLLFPEILKLEKKYLKIVSREKDFFLGIGVDLEPFGENEVAIKSAPPKLQNSSLKELVLEVAHFIEENENLDKEVFRKKLTEHTHSHMACKAAVKAGDTLSHDEIQKLVLQLRQTNNRFICVHGRPTMWTISQYELEKKFQRRK